MNELDLQKPKRQAPVGVAVLFFKNLRAAINVFISIILVEFGLNFSILGLGLEGLGVVVAIIFLVISYLQYRRFFFYVVEDKFVIEKGVLNRDKITIDFDRIQTVNVNQNVVQRLLSVVAVNIDTAGSAQRELEIPALQKAYARELQKFLIEKKEQTRAEQEGRDETAEETEERQKEEEMDISDRRPLVHLGLKDLLLVGLTENHLRTGLVLFAVINGYVWQYQDYILRYFEPQLEEQATLIMKQWLVLLPIALLLFLVVSVLLSMIQAVLRYFNLYFFVDRKGVQIISGLLKRSEYQIPVNKIQYLKWKSNPLRKMLGLKTLVVKQASTEHVGDRQSIKIPGCRQEELNVVLDEFYPERSENGFYLYAAHPLLFIQLGTWLGAIPAIGLSALYFYQPYLVFTGLVYLPLALFFMYKYYRSVGLAINPDMLILKKGWVYPNQEAAKFYKLQDVSYSQSIFQKRRKLASISFHSAAGDMTMPHIPQDEAHQIYNYVLYKIESSEKSWM